MHCAHQGLTLINYRAPIEESRNPVLAAPTNLQIPLTQTGIPSLVCPFLPRSALLSSLHSALLSSLHSALLFPPRSTLFPFALGPLVPSNDVLVSPMHFHDDTFTISSLTALGMGEHLLILLNTVVQNLPEAELRKMRSALNRSLTAADNILYNMALSSSVDALTVSDSMCISPCFRVS